MPLDHKNPKAAAEVSPGTARAPAGLSLLALPFRASAWTSAKQARSRAGSGREEGHGWGWRGDRGDRLRPRGRGSLPQRNWNNEPASSGSGLARDRASEFARALLVLQRGPPLAQDSADSIRSLPPRPFYEGLGVDARRAGLSTRQPDAGGRGPSKRRKRQKTNRTQGGAFRRPSPSFNVDAAERGPHPPKEDRNRQRRTKYQD